MAHTLAASYVLLSGLPSFATVLVGIVPPEKGLRLQHQEKNRNLCYRIIESLWWKETFKIIKYTSPQHHIYTPLKSLWG